MQTCPRCKLKVLDCEKEYGESGIFQSCHRLCMPCFEAEEIEIEAAGTNNLPETLRHWAVRKFNLVDVCGAGAALCLLSHEMFLSGTAVFAATVLASSLVEMAYEKRNTRSPISNNKGE